MASDDESVVTAVEFTAARASRRDAAAIADLSLELGYPAGVEPVRGRLAEILRSPDDALFVAADGSGRVVGWVHVFAARRLETEAFAEIGGLVVAGPYRRRGIGRGLIERAAEWAAARSHGSLRVRSNTAREAAHRFYLGIGFERLKTQAVYELESPPSAAGDRNDPE